MYISSPSLYITNTSPVTNTYVGISQKRLSLKGRFLSRLWTYPWPMPCLCRPTPDLFCASVHLPLTYLVLLPPWLWLVPLSVYNQLCAQWVVPAKWPFVGTIRHLHCQTSCKCLIVSACSHLWLQLSGIQVCPVLCTIQGRKSIFPKRWFGLHTPLQSFCWVASGRLEPFCQAVLCKRKQGKPNTHNLDISMVTFKRTSNQMKLIETSFT